MPLLSKWEIDAKYMTNPLSAHDDKSAHTSKGNILIVMFHAGVYRKNEDEIKE